MDSTKSNPGNIVPLKVKEVTAAVIAQLKSVPFERANEGATVPQNMLPSKLIPQADESKFLKLYVTNDLIKNNALDITSSDFFPNYQGRIFEFEEKGVKQLLLVGLSNDLDLSMMSDRSFPFLIYIPPSPQDNAEAHKKLYPKLYEKTRPQDIPYFYKNTSGYPYTWDWLNYQFFSNMYKLSYQLKKAERPYVFVVPLVKSFTDGISFLNSAELLEKALLAIQKFYLDERFGENKYNLMDLKYITFASFSIGNTILSNFIAQNRQHPFFRDKVKDFFILDPPPNNPNNRSPITQTLVSVMTADATKSILLYAQDDYYIKPLIQTFITPKGIAFDLSKDKIFKDQQVKNVFFAHLQDKLFLKHIQDPTMRDVHNTFPNLFINHAAARSPLRFPSFNGRQIPGY